ncbi:MAG: response regulator, partial [Armatimonadetes bacterium]|nr:response regulator [Armatimonadota bacterium]
PIVLVIDDEQAFRTACRETLEYAGYGVLEASEGLEGVQLFRAQCDAIAGTIMDWMMPGLSGGHWIKLIRETDPEARILLCTGHVLNEAARERLKSDGIGVVKKPVDAEGLLSAVAKAFGSAHGDVGEGEGNPGMAETSASAEDKIVESQGDDQGRAGDGFERRAMEMLGHVEMLMTDEPDIFDVEANCGSAALLEEKWRRCIGVPSSAGTIEQDAATEPCWQVGVGVLGCQDEDTSDAAQVGYIFTVTLVEGDTTFRAERVVGTPCEGE